MVARCWWSIFWASTCPVYFCWKHSKSGFESPMGSERPISFLAGALREIEAVGPTEQACTLDRVQQEARFILAILPEVGPFGTVAEEIHPTDVHPVEV
ncbi:hypothetical protein Nepgr_017234 [Nepenthes gracilis]|uniref:Uncharacterized protein n=1 Tax=Nepenthes gracilis TaxID=150966 RepID=A0AAD3SP25_NEPGR|nr:hypothetical protein Nepgr_017234 [Nepenthes gracilis]